MAKQMGALKVYYIMLFIFFGALVVALGFETSCFTRQRLFHAADNRALRNSAYVNQTVVRSRVTCGRECSMDERCKSFNFYDCKKLCELNHATRSEHLEYFNATQGSVYFDADEDTPSFSLTDRSFDRYRSCKMLLDAGYHSSGVYTIYPDGLDDDGGLCVFCDMETDGGGWIVFQRRQDGSVDFYRGWSDYQFGFGDLSGEFWLGNDNLVALTSDGSQGTWELRVNLEDWDGNTAWAKYTDFKISPGEYKLNYNQYDASSTAGDSLCQGMPYTTKDRDNDKWPYNSADYFKGAWWFGGCGSHLNGKYYPFQHPYEDLGVVWLTWKQTYYSMKKCSIKMRVNDQ